MASGEAEPLQYTTTVLRVSIHCEGCKKKVKKVLHSIEGVYKVTIDAAQHKVIVTGSVGADALVRRLQKAGKQAALWPVPAPVAEAAKKPEEVAAAPSAAGDGGKDANDKADATPKEKKGADKQGEAEASVKKPEKEKGSVNKKPEKDNGAEKKPEKEKGAEKKPAKAEAAAAKQQKDGDAKKDKDAAEPKEKGSPEPAAKEAAAEEASAEEGSAKKGKKKKNKQKDGGDGGEPAASEKTPTQPAMAALPPPQLLGPAERPHGAFPYYAAQPVMSYNVTHPSASVSYYAPTPAMPMPPPPPPPHHVPYGYPPMMPPPPMPEYMYGPPGMRSSPPHESYNNMFNEENANSCSLM